MNVGRYLRLKKLERLAAGQKPRIVDLFSGCGGLSLGFYAAGYDLVAGLEIDDLAARSYASNFHSDEGSERLALFAKPRDITRLDAHDFLKELYPDTDPAALVDIIVGGPPCQAFARVGRAKLREVFRHREAFRLDPRAKLYLQYMRYIEVLQPLAVVLENVPDILNYGGHNIPQEICDTLDDMGYVCSYTLINAVYYGVPQMRERVFLIGIAQELGIDPSFPAPTHWIDLPQGYENARKVALRSMRSTELYPDLFGIQSKGSNYVKPPEATPDLRPAVSVREAIGDLPPITEHLEGRLKRGPRRLDSFVPYPTDTYISEYARLMREWPGFEGKGGVYDHVIRCLPRDYAIFRRMAPGDQYPEAYEVAKQLFRERLEQLREAGEIIEPGTPEYTRLWVATVPPYDPGKFPNKWRKMEADLPARTLMAHLGKDGYSHIHYDSEQARTISVREAARLQSFPDGFRFKGTMNPAFRQIGNAVPPLLARAIAEEVKQALDTAIHGAEGRGTASGGGRSI